jgi:hypothetical protein
MMVFAVALQTLNYNPQILLFIFITIELFYLIGSAIKYWTIKHFVSSLHVIHLMVQNIFLVVFLSLVTGMTFKEEKYGNGSTLGDLDRAKWTYGETFCIWVVLVAVLTELCMFVGNFILMLRQIFSMVKSGI